MGEAELSPVRLCEIVVGLESDTDLVTLLTVIDTSGEIDGVGDSVGDSEFDDDGVRLRSLVSEAEGLVDCCDVNDCDLLRVREPLPSLDNVSEYDFDQLALSSRVGLSVVELD